MKRIIYALLIALVPLPAMAQTPLQAINFPIFRAFDPNGKPLAGGLLYSYAAGTSTPLATYTDASGSTPNLNPVVLDSTGSAHVFLNSVAYKFVLKDQFGVQQWSADNIIGASAASILSSPSGSQTVIQPAGSSLNVNVLNNVEDASLFAGSDIGVKINAAFAACPVTQSCKVTLPPGHNYSFSTMFTIPGSLPFSALDCQGSGLTFTGTGDAVQVASENVNDASGYIANCFFYNGGGNTSSVNAIHQFSRNAFSYRDVSIDNFNNATSAGIFLDNVAEGWGGYNERTRLQNVTFSYDTKGLRLKGYDGGTNSFARLVMIGAYCAAQDGQMCVSVEGNNVFQSADAYDGFFDIRGNLSGTATGAGAARGVSVTGGGDIRSAVFNVGLEGPSTTNFYYIDNSSGVSSIEGVGMISSGGAGYFNGGVSSQFNVPIVAGGNFVIQPPPFVMGLAQSRNAKFISNNGIRFGIPIEGSLPLAEWQIFTRVTTNVTDPEVDAQPSTGNIQHNLAFCDFHGCGFGNGYGFGATLGGTNLPAHDLEFNGSFGNQTGTFGVDSSGVETVSNVKTGSTSSTNFAGAITLSGGVGTFTFSPAFASPPFCLATDTVAVAAVEAASSTTTLTIHGTGTDQIAYICVGKN